MPRTRIFAATAAALLVALSGTLASAAPADAATRPQVGQCRTTTFFQTFSSSDTNKPVPCSRRHSVKTFAVADIPRGIDYVHISDPTFYRVARTICTRPFWRAIGGSHATRAQVAYDWVFFGPTLAQRKSGARWLRCDLELLATVPGASTVLAPLPDRAFPMVGSRPITDSIRRCLSDATHHYWTICTRAHTARADQTFKITAAVRPPQSTIDAAAATRCPGKRTTKPSPYDWKLGNHVITCYTVTTH